MGNFFTLVQIENMKLWKRLSTKVMLIMMIVIVIAATGIFKFYSISNNTSDITMVPESWKQDLQQKLAVGKAQLESLENSTDKTSKLLIGSMKKSIAENDYRINNDIKPESQNNVWTRITKFDTQAGYSSIISLFLIIACTALVAGEFSEGTMKMMISRPYKRYEILTAKLMAIILYGIVLLITTFLMNFIMMGLFFGFNGLESKEMLWTSRRIIYIPAVLKTLIVFGLDFLQVLVYGIVAFAISAISRSRSIATGVSLFLLLVGSTLAQTSAVYFSWGKYLPFGMSNFSGIVNTGLCVEGTTLAYAIGLSAMYSIIFCFAGYLVFEKRDI